MVASSAKQILEAEIRRTSGSIEPKLRRHELLHSIAKPGYMDRVRYFPVLGRFVGVSEMRCVLVTESC